MSQSMSLLPTLNAVKKTSNIIKQSLEMNASLRHL